MDTIVIIDEKSLWTSVLKSGGSPDWGFKTKGPEGLKEYDYSAVLLNLKKRDADIIFGLQDLINKKDLHEYGMEKEPHITLKFGLHTGSVRDVEKFGRNLPIDVKVGKLSLFESEKFDVLKIGVSGYDIHRLHDKISKLPNSDTFPNYMPHISVAFLKRGEGKKYLDLFNALEGQEIEFDEMVFSDKFGQHIVIDNCGRDRAGRFAAGNNCAAKSLKKEGQWRTINGAKVFIEDGKITKGPAALVGRSEPSKRSRLEESFRSEVTELKKRYTVSDKEVDSDFYYDEVEYDDMPQELKEEADSNFDKWFDGWLKEEYESWDPDELDWDEFMEYSSFDVEDAQAESWDMVYDSGDEELIKAYNELEEAGKLKDANIWQTLREKMPASELDEKFQENHDLVEQEIHEQYHQQNVEWQETQKEEKLQELQNSQYDNGMFEQFFSDWRSDNEDEITEAMAPAKAEENIWHGNEKSRTLRFTAGKNNYIVEAEQNTFKGESVRDIQFYKLAENGDADFEITGDGNANKVFSNVIGSLLALHEKEPKDMMSFTAHEGSRRKLYNRLAKRVSLVMPEYKTVSKDLSGKRQYVIAKRDRTDIWAGIKEEAKEFDVIVKSSSKSLIDLALEKSLENAQVKAGKQSTAKSLDCGRDSKGQFSAGNTCQKKLQEVIEEIESASNTQMPFDEVDQYRHVTKLQDDETIPEDLADRFWDRIGDLHEAELIEQGHNLPKKETREEPKNSLEDDINDIFKSVVKEGVWRTINGARVYIEDGKITKGPANLIGATEGQAGDHPEKKEKKPTKEFKDADRKTQKEARRLKELLGDGWDKHEELEDVKAYIEQGMSDEEILNAMTELVGEQTESAILEWAEEEFGDELAPNGKTKAENFLAWWKDSKATTKDGDRPQEMMPIRVFHGTTHEFEEFDYENANPENDMGRGHYFTEAYSDAENNYGAEGADLTSRISQMEDRLSDGYFIGELESDIMGELVEGKEGDIYDDDGVLIDQKAGADVAQMVAENHNLKDQDQIDAVTRFAQGHTTTEQFTEEMARAMVAGETEKVIESYLSIQNPVVVGDPKWGGGRVRPAEEGETVFSYSIKEEDGQGRTPDHEDFDYDSASFVGEEGTLLDLFEEIKSEAHSYEDIDMGQLNEDLSEIASAALDYGDLPAGQVISQLKSMESIAYAQDYDNDGAMVSSELVSNALANLGHDGIIYNDASDHFPNFGVMNGSPIPHGTRHFIVWDSAQIKSVDNNGDFDPSNSNITKSWDESKHARHGKGDSDGGQFAKKETSDKTKESSEDDDLVLTAFDMAPEEGSKEGSSDVEQKAAELLANSFDDSDAYVRAVDYMDEHGLDAKNLLKPASKIILENHGLTEEEAIRATAMARLMSGYEKGYEVSQELNWAVAHGLEVSPERLNDEMAKAITEDPDLFTDKQVNGLKNVYGQSDSPPDQYFDLLDIVKERRSEARDHLSKASVREAGEYLAGLSEHDTIRMKVAEDAFKEKLENMEPQYTNADPSGYGKMLSKDSTKVYEMATAAGLSADEDGFVAADGSKDAARIKSEIMKDVGGKISKRVPQEKIDAFLDDSLTESAQKVLYRDGLGAEDSGEVAAAMLVKQWAKSSTNGNKHSVAVQMAVANAFDVEEKGHVHGSTSKTIAEAKEHYEKHKDVYDAYAQSTYESTQAKLKEFGIKEVRVFRGLGLQSEYGDRIKTKESIGNMIEVREAVNGKKNSSKAWIVDREIKSNPISSFSSDLGVATDFASGNGWSHKAVIAAVVPAEDVFSSFLTGPGCVDEAEFVVLGKKRSSKMAIYDREKSGMTRSPAALADMIEISEEK